MTDAVRVQGLTRRFDDLVAVDGLDFSVREKEVLGIVGPDAAGKTTLLRMLVGVLAPTAGQIEICGLDIQKERARTRLLIGYMSQAFSLYEDLSVAENIWFFATLRRVGSKDRKARAERLLEATQLAPFIKRRAGQLSGGMKQKLGLICTLIHEPKVLVLDEPTNGVDPVSRREFWDIIGELREKITIIVSTPAMDEAERCDRVALMAEGKFLALAQPEALPERVSAPVWEVEVDRPFAASELLEQQLPGSSVQLFGDRIHVVTEAHDSALAEILSAGGHATPRIQRVRPTLEDAFVQLITGRAP